MAIRLACLVRPHYEFACELALAAPHHVPFRALLHDVRAKGAKSIARFTSR